MFLCCYGVRETAEEAIVLGHHRQASHSLSLRSRARRSSRFFTICSYLHCSYYVHLCFRAIHDPFARKHGDLCGGGGGGDGGGL